MEFLNKIEEFINRFLFKVGHLLKGLLLKYTPQKILLFQKKIKEHYSFFKVYLKTFPSKFIEFSKSSINLIKEKINELDLKNRIEKGKIKLKETFKDLKLHRYQYLKKLFTAPWSFISIWFQGLTPTQTVLLTTLTAASIVAILNIISSSHRIAKVANVNRAPAEAQEEFEFDRPIYYKKYKKHVLMTSVRLPVYHENVNDLKTVDIDFNVTLSNRHTRNALEKFEFQLRDYLILKLEPQVPEFMLVDEGKEIMRQKIWEEIDEFLKMRNINGKVTEVQITYVLAN